MKTVRTDENDNPIMLSDRQLLEQINANVTVMSVKLFGASDADEENASGRMPKVEASAKAAHARLDEVEKKVIRIAAGIATIGVLAEVLSHLGLHITR